MAALPDQAANKPLLNNSAEQHTDTLTPEASQQNRKDVGTEMATLPDQTASEPMLINATEQQAENLAPGSSQPSQNDLRSSEGKPNDALQFLFPDDRFWSVACIVGGFFVALVLAVGHHIFLQYLNGRNIEASPQVWIKGANNGFSNIFSIFVGLSAASALTQIKWRASGSEPLRMYTIDNLFALPGPLALLKTLMRPRSSLFFPILSSVLIHALLLVNVLAPSALTVASSQQVSRDIGFPIFSLASQSQFAEIAFSSSVSGEVEVHSFNLSTIGEQRIDSVLLHQQDVTWAIPQQCGLICAFHFNYNAPALECHDVISGDYRDVNNSYTVITHIDTNLSPPNRTASPSQVDVPYDLSINQTAADHSLGITPSSPIAGTYCRFFQATYKASFELNTNSSTQRANTSIVSRGDYLSWRNTLGEITFNNVPAEAVASWALCYAFAVAFRGDFLPSLLQTYPALDPFFNINGSGSFDLAVSNLSQTLVDMFSNLTLGLMSTRGSQDTVTASATMWDGSSVWVYTAWLLWTAYLPALILAIIVALCGLYTIHASGIAMDDTFSTFLLATQNAKLYEMCEEATDFEELQRFQLIHQKKGPFLVVDSDIKLPN